MIPHRDYLASAPQFFSVAESIAQAWSALGATGSFLAHNIDTGDELGFDVDLVTPILSVIKVPIALTVLDQIAQGAFGADHELRFDPKTTPEGPAGAAALRHGGALAVGDLVTLMLTVSDNTAADLLLGLVGLEQLNDSLREWNRSEIRARHRLRRLFECAADVSNGDFHLALELAIQSEATGTNSIETLDPNFANVGTARELVGLLGDVWLNRISDPSATAELRRLMAMQVYHHRLSSDLRSDSIQVSGKTGSFLHLRHEIGVVESDIGDRVAIAALTRSDRRASIAHDIDLSIGAAARLAFEALRS